MKEENEKMVDDEISIKKEKGGKCRGLACLSNNNWKILVIFGLPLVLIPLPILLGSEGKGLYILLLMAIFWVTEALPVAVTSFIPIVFAPLLGVIQPNDISLNYAKDVLLLMLGGIMAGLCIEKWNLHSRIAIRVLLLFGTGTRWLMLGIMLPTWFLSMWISNTATTAMMVPIVAAILDQLHTSSKPETTKINDSDMIELQPAESEGPSSINDISVNIEESNKNHKVMKKVMLLCVAYSASCGGIATLTGTPPNLLFKGTMDRLYGDEHDITFGSWMAFAFPLSTITLIVCWVWLNVYFFGIKSFFTRCACRGEDQSEILQVLRNEYKKLGPISNQEKLSAVLFCLLVLLWLTRDSELFTGWKHILGEGTAKDSTTAMFILLLMFSVPSQLPSFKGDVKYTPLLNWEFVSKRFPWQIYFLLGGGLALADVCETSGITRVMVNQLTGMKSIPPQIITLVICLLVSAATEIMSNTAMASILLPVVVDLAKELGLNPMSVMLALTVACSFAFMLPIATPPNAVVFAHGTVTVLDMVKAGVILNILCLLILQIAINTWAVPLFQLNTIPPWMNGTISNQTVVP